MPLATLDVGSTRDRAYLSEGGFVLLESVDEPDDEELDDVEEEPPLVSAAAAFLYESLR